MGLFNKKADPISERERRLNEEIAALETQIRRLDKQAAQATAPAPAGPRLRASGPAAPRREPAPAATAPRTPVFEPNDYQKSGANLEPETTPQHFNELGVRKFDLPAAWRRLRNYLRGPGAHNPKLVSYLAAGSIKGLRPLRYEKRVARNRFIALFLILVVLIWGLAAALLRH